MTVFTCIILVVTGTFPGFTPPPGGIGDEILPLNSRSFGMGGICASIPDSTRFSLLNPAVSARAENSGICFGGRYTEGDVNAWDNRLGFTMVSAMVPLPGGIVIAGAIDGRSRLDTQEDMSFDRYTGNLSWTGGLVESYIGFSVKATDWFAFSAGGRCTFGKIISDVVLCPINPSPPLPQNTVYRDDASFRQAWGGEIGFLVNIERFGLGFALSTDRKGNLDVFRDYSTRDRDSSSQMYTIPGELTVGISFRPIQRLLLGMDIYSRKLMNILDTQVDAGTVYSVGTEVYVGSGLSARAGFNHMNGLWRDGADRFTAGVGYTYGEGRAGLDISAGYQFWRDLQDELQKETVLYISLWATEKWLGE